ncbi:Xaa-Pro dipeptidyl-peptidase [Alkalibacillus haloalkaliphilus]|uniref:Xaa-Pro dipeptidyl-peptidase n=1 Tax=Alkalibacillus haloalkaliphilus TaxID=94136 RepID=A0A511W9Q1_9BACI|nr:Xaa-Pro dipeptidyl-peptidase [Alkalibacillus haloalkaliphilus]GEN47078.1 Xaa-Pro dipeptidyl-peptidase [Alkalibacillus haloalkaliphilus]
MKIGRITISLLLSLLLILSSTTTFTLAETPEQGNSNSPMDLPLNGLIPETNSETTAIELEDGKTAPIYSTEDAIIENLWIETEIDSDRTGENDMVSIQVMRPNTDEDIKIPTILEVSPYRAGLRPLNFFDVDHDLTPVPHNGNGHGRTYDGKPMSSPQNLGNLGNFYVPRGYAVILAESIGSGSSTGCATTGDPNETLGAKAIVDWLNGDAKAFNDDGDEVAADWSTGNVGMTGASYNGTLANAVATTGVEGLQTIVPVVAISNWYDYFRANGAVVAPGGFQGEDASVLADAVMTRDNAEVCDPILDEMVEDEDRITGDYNEFWDERNYLNDVDQVEASVLVVHGLNDLNVRTNQFAQWWEALSDHNVPRKMFLHQGGHSAPGTSEYQETLHLWFDYWLYGIDNGIMDEPTLDIQREDGTWHKENSWPHVDANTTKLHFQPTEENLGSLKDSPIPNQPHETHSLVDAPNTNPESLVSDPDNTHDNRLVYTSDPLSSSVRMSGNAEVSIRANLDQPVSNLTAYLVDYNENGSFNVVSRGWMDAQNIHGPERSISLVPGRDYTFKWDMQAHDYVFSEGSSIGIVIMASDHDHTIRPITETEVTITPTRSYLELPLVGDLNFEN